jgi:hypothetical protein
MAWRMAAQLYVSPVVVLLSPWRAVPLIASRAGHSPAVLLKSVHTHLGAGAPMRYNPTSGHSKAWIV